MVISFEATDVFVFYIFFEAMLIPMYFLIGGFGDRAGERSEEETATQRSYAAVKFLLYNLAGGLIMLAAVVGLYAVTADDLGTGTFSLQQIVEARASGQLDMATSTERLLFLGFFFAFAVKAPLWPLHTWLPNAMGESTSPVAVLITAVVDKVGTFAMLRFCLQLFPEASKWATPVILVLALISIIYGALLAIGQRDIKRLIAYASISHFGFIILGIFAMTTQGQGGATLYMVNHGISTAALMLVAGFLITRRGSRLIADYGGVQKVAPVLAGTFLIGGLATLSLPGLAPFVSEFLVLVGAFARYPVVGVIATLGIVLAALYVLILYQRTMTGPVKEEVRTMPDLRPRELLVVAPLIALLLFLGVYPKPLTDIVNPAVDHTLSVVDEKDPKPDHPVTDAGWFHYSPSPRVLPTTVLPEVPVTHAATVHSLWTTAAAAPDKIPAPHIEYGQLAPTLIVLGAAIIGVLVEAFLPRATSVTPRSCSSPSSPSPRPSRPSSASPRAATAPAKAHVAAMGAIAVDGPALFLQGTILLVALVSVFTFAERRLDPVVHGNRVDSFAAQAAAVPGGDAEKAAVKAGFTTTEVFPLVLFAVGGMLVFPAANDLLTLFVALEVFSLPLYILCALARRHRMLSQESAVKYFLLGAFSSAFLLFGIALLYGYAGTVTYAGIADVVDGQVRNITPALAGTMGNDALLLLGGALVLMGLLFKIGAVPFHMWTPDVYQGAPTPVTGFMAAATKVAAFGALLRLLYVVLPGLRWDWRPVMWGVAIVTMLGGAIVAVTQTDVKRLLAYSSIAHAGFILAGVIATDPGGHLLRPLLPRRVLLRDPRRLRRGHPGARRGRRGHRTCRSGPGSAAVRPWWPPSSRSSCWPSPVSR